MMSLTEIKSFYPDFLHNRGEFILREYLQYKILEIIFKSDYAQKFAFLGGTCLRINHNNQRFSEDLDFDNFDLTSTDFDQVSDLIENALTEQGYKVEIRNVKRGAYHCYIRFPGILFETGLSSHKEAKILIKLDTEPQHFSFESIILYLNKFDVFTNILTTPLDILLSQKFTAITQRKRPKGRDFFDVIFLVSRTKPNYDFLKMKLDIANKTQLKEHLLETCKQFDFQFLANDVEPFLFYQKDIQRILSFTDYIKTVEF